MPKPGDIYYDPEKNIMRFCMGKEYIFFGGCLDWRWAFIEKKSDYIIFKILELDPTEAGDGFGNRFLGRDRSCLLVKKGGCGKKKVKK